MWKHASSKTLINLNKFFQVKMWFFWACLPSSHQRWQRPVWDYEDWFDELYKSSASTLYLKKPQEAVRFMNRTYSGTMCWNSVLQKGSFIPSSSPHKDNIVTCFGGWQMMEGFFLLLIQLVTEIPFWQASTCTVHIHKVLQRHKNNAGPLTLIGLLLDILGTYIRTG